jgi:hypothetical protein
MQRGLLLLAMVAAGVGAVSVACTAEVSDPRYGPPGGLRNSQLPSPATGSGTGTGTAPTSTPEGGTGEGGVNPASCTVKFSTDIYPSMQQGGTWKCASTNGCHGGAGAPSVTIDPNNAATAYTTLSKYTATGGKPYFNANSTDPNASAVTCNLAGQCGGQMPPPGNAAGGAADPATEAKLKTWLQCGAPNN